MTGFDEEPEHQPTKKEYDDAMLLRRVWDANPEIKTLQMKKMVFDNEVTDIARAAIPKWRNTSDEHPLTDSTVIVKTDKGTLVSCEYQGGSFYSVPAALIIRNPISWMYWRDL